MENKFHKMFNHSDCIPEKTLLAYIKDELSPKEKHAVEKHMLHCEMCSDALEGLMFVKNKNRIPELISKLNKKILQQQPQRKPKIIWMDTRVRVAIAAAVALLLVSVFLLKNFTAKQADKIFSENMEAYPSEMAEEKTILSDSSKVVAEEITKEKTTPDQEVPPPVADQTAALKTPAKSGKLEAGNKRYENEAGDMMAQTEQPTISANAEEFTVTNEISSGEKFSEKNIDGTFDAAKKSQSNLGFVNIPKEDAAGKDLDNKDLSEVYFKSDDDRKSLEEKKKEKANKPDESRSKKESLEGEKQQAEKKSLTKSMEDKEELKQAISTKDAKPAAAQPKAAQQKEPETIVVKDEEDKNANYNINTQSTTTNNASPAGAGTTYSWTTPSRTDSTKVTATVSVMDSLSAVSEMKLNQAMNKYDAKDYAGAIKLFEEILKSQPNNYNTLFYSAVSYLSLAYPNPDKAIANLDKVLKIQNGQFYDAANWYKGLAYIKKDDKEQARKALKQVKSAEYRKKAEATLDEIK